jgi:SAM-dependent methyltransferase
MNAQFSHPQNQPGFQATHQSEQELARRYGFEISNQSIQLRQVSSEEAIYIQMYPLLNGPDVSLNRQLWKKLARTNVWQRTSKDREPLSIEVHENKGLPPKPIGWYVPAESPQQLEDSYPATLWGLQFVPAGEVKILQAGAMTEHEPLLMKCLDSRRQIVVVDLLVECARNSKLAELDSAVASLSALPLPAGYFDCVYNNNVLEHLYNNVDDVLSEIHRVLKTNGVFSFVLPIETNISNPDRIFQDKNLGKSLNWWLVDPSHPWKTDLYDINYRLKQAGFDNIRFAFRSNDLAAFAKRNREIEPRKSILIRLLKMAYLAFEESLFFHELESRMRSLLHLYRGMAYRTKIRKLLGLPNRHDETLQVLVRARKAAKQSKYNISDQNEE